ncbi:MAG: metallophosphoesterase family protein, partial [Candidatus Heimdallarchaeota archaeon]
DYPLSNSLCLGNQDLGVRFIYGYNNQQPSKQDFKLFKKFPFREAAVHMLERNAQSLQEEQFQFLQQLPFKQMFKHDQLTLYFTHGTPSVRKQQNVGKYVYPPPIQNPQVTIDRLKYDKKAEAANIVAVGHTHQRFLITRDTFFSWSLIDDIYEKRQTKFPLKFSFTENRIIFNPGSVGQPRDGTGNASFVILDIGNETIEFYDLEYPMEIFYRLTEEYCVPDVQDASFWSNKFGHFSNGA